MMSVLDHTIVERHSIRKFLPLPVPRRVVDEALALPRHEPSNSQMTTYGMYTERMFRLRDARIEARRKHDTVGCGLCGRALAGVVIWPR